MAIANIQALAAQSPVGPDRVTVDWVAFEEGLHVAGYQPSSALATSWCKFGDSNIAALVDAPTLAVIFPTGVYVSTGKRKMFGKDVKWDGVAFASCHSYGAVEHTDDRGLGKFGIEFNGPGNILIARLHWSWRGKAFRDSRGIAMAAASERDRVLTIINSAA